MQSPYLIEQLLCRGGYNALRKEQITSVKQIHSFPNLDKPEKNDPQISQIDADKNMQSAKSADNFLYMVQKYH